MQKVWAVEGLPFIPADGTTLYLHSGKFKNNFKHIVTLKLLHSMSGKNTHISRISNSVTHLKNYTNMENSSPILPRLYLLPHQAPMSPCQMLISPYWVPMLPFRVVMSPYRTASISQCFMCVSWCFTSCSQCFTSVLWCFMSFMIFNNVFWCLVSHAMIGIIDCQSLQGSAIMLQGLAIASQCLATIVEETLTSGKYISLFIISILFIYKYKIKKITWRAANFLKKCAKTGNQRKLRKWREQMHPFCCYSSSENINCHSIQAERKKYVNNIERALDFYYYSPFLHGNTLTFSTYGTDGRLDGYLSLRCIY